MSTGQQTELLMPQMSLKFATLNMFNLNLQVIDLNYNKIAVLPRELVEISNLRSLKLAYNELCCLPPEMCKLSKLETLVLSHNKLTNLFMRMQSLQSLEVLLVNNNSLTEVPESLGQLLQLKRLHLHDNRLASLPRAMSKLTKLEEFSIEWFQYTRPTNSKVQRNQEVLRSIRDFLGNFAQQVRGRRSLSQGARLVNDSIGTQGVSTPTVSFCDFLVQYHKLPHMGPCVDDLWYTIKRRSLPHFICSN